MKKIKIILLLLTTLLVNVSFGQDFSSAQINPFNLSVVDSPNISLNINFVDMDGDGDLDAVHGGIDSTGAIISIQENIGTVSDPIFGPHSKFQFGELSTNFLFIPTIEDVTGDDKPDILAFGEMDSVTGLNHIFYKNISSAGNLSFEATRADNIGLPGIGEGIYLPQLIDLNLDGDIDVLLSGQINTPQQDSVYPGFSYGQNTGNLTEPRFVGWFDSVYNYTMQDTASLNLSVGGDLDNDGDIDILSFFYFQESESSPEELWFSYFENTASPGMSPHYTTPVKDPFGLMDTLFGFPELVDIDGDGDLDLFLYNSNTEEIVLYENIACVISNSDLQMSICEGDTVFIGNSEYTAQGSYVDTLLSMDGCDSILSLTLDVTEIDTTLSLNDDQLTVNENDADNYQWFNCDTDLDVQGATSRNFTPTQTGHYAVRMTKDNCTFESNCQFVMLTAVENIRTLGIQFAPNPAREYLHILNAGSLDIDNTIYFINAAGSMIEQFILPSGKVALHGLMHGSYTLLIQVEGKYYSDKVVVQ